MSDTTAAEAATQLTHPPVAARREHRRTHHGDTVVDPYEWLRDGTDPEVVAHLEAENAWTEQQTAHLADLRADVVGSILARTRQTDVSVPTYTVHGDGADATAWWYYTRTVEGSEYPIHCRVPASGPDDPPDPEGDIPGEVVLLDGNVEAEGHEFFSLGAFDVSPDGTLLAWSVDTTGGERFTMHVKDLRTGTLLPDVIEDTAYGTAWAGNDHLLYTRADAAWRPWIVLAHRLGSDPAGDREVFSEPDERFWVGVGLSRDERWILIGSGSKLSSEWRLLAADDPDGTPRVVCPRREGVEYDVEVAGDRLLIMHNDGALDYMVSQAPLDATGPEQWQTVLPHTPGVRITDVDAYRDHVVVQLRRDGLTGIHLIPRDASGDLLPGHDLAFEQELYTVASLGSANWVTDRIRIGFTSMITPFTVHDLDLATSRLTELKRTEVLPHPDRGPYREEDYRQFRTWATAPDGTRVPISVVTPKSLPRNGSAPLVLYGYGSYEHSIDPYFSIPRLSFLDHGCGYAIAHVRGGGELGRQWYDDGKMLHKQHTFSDFIACAEHLIAEGWTSADRLGAVGGSAGGLLMGAVANQAPGLFRAIHAAVPFVDALTTILDPELPLTVTEWEEWGNPLADPEVYAYMKGYTPYENVADHPYPAILATTSLNDTRVFFTEPAKWIARLREVVDQPSDRPILLKTEMVAGHGGVSGRYQRWNDIAFETAWLIDQLTGDRPLVTSPPVVMAPRADGFEVVWSVSAPARGWVEWAPAAEPGRVTTCTDDGYGFVPQGTEVLRIRLAGLPPGTDHLVRTVTVATAGARREVSDWKRARTLDPGAATTSLVVWNDTHQHRDTLERLAAVTPPADVWLWNGDVGNNWHDPAEIAPTVLSPVADADLTDGRPLAFVRGNHDVRGRWAHRLREVVATPQGLPYYAFRSGPVAVVVLDTGEDKPDDHPSFGGRAAFAPLRQRQADWLRDQVRRPGFADAPYRVVVCHIPLRGVVEPQLTAEDYAAGKWDTWSRTGRELWHDALVDWGTQLVVSGHNHRPALLPATDGFPYAQVIGGGPDPERARWIGLRADARRLTVRVHDLDGAVTEQIAFDPVDD